MLPSQLHPKPVPHSPHPHNSPAVSFHCQATGLRVERPISESETTTEKDHTVCTNEIFNTFLHNSISVWPAWDIQQLISLFTLNSDSH